MLLPARKTPLLDSLYARYGRRLLRRAFARVWVGGAAWPAGDGPTIAFLNHGAWWDPVLALFLARDAFALDAYGVMEGAQLRKYPFFRAVGVFGVLDDGRPLDDARALAAYVTRTLRGAPRRSVWIFPQGALLPAHTPLAFRSGLTRLARAVPEATVVPIAVRYEFRAEQRPECFVRVGVAASASDGSTPAHTRHLERRLRDELHQLDTDILHPTPPGYRVVLAGRGSVSAAYVALASLRGR